MNPFVDAFLANFPVMLSIRGEVATYVSADSTETEMQCVATTLSEDKSLDASWETAAKRLEVFAAVSDAPADYVPREDQIIVRGITYTVMDRVTDDGAVYRFLCEREEVDAVRGRGRLY